MLDNYTLNILEFGAIGDGQTDNTAAIQKAMDTCGQNGGGTVYVPSGQFVTGTIQFRKHTTLFLEQGALLCTSENPEQFIVGGKLRHHRLLVADQLEHISICGHGTIVGLGQEELQRRAGTIYDKNDRPRFRPGGVHFYQCRHVAIRNIHFRHSDNWTLCIDQCEDVLIDGIHIENNYFRTNSDGIDIVSCENVRIANCNIIAGDDGIVLKTLARIPCRNVVVTNCIIECCATGLKIGTETFGDLSDILFLNCIVKNSYGGAGIFVKDGATVERVKFSHCLFATYDDPYSVNLTQSVCPIFVDTEKRNSDSDMGTIRDISFQDIHVRSENSIVIQSPKDHPIVNLSLRNLFFDVTDEFDFSGRSKPAGTIHAYHVDAGTEFVRKEAYIVLANIDGLVLDDVHVRIQPEMYQKTPRHAVYGCGIQNGTLRLVRRTPSDERLPDVLFEGHSSIDRR